MVLRSIMVAFLCEVLMQDSTGARRPRSNCRYERPTHHGNGNSGM